MKSARTCDKIPTLLPIEADACLASVRGSPNPAASIESRAWACGLAEFSADYPGILSGKAIVPPPPLVARAFYHTPTAHRYVPSCMLRGTAHVRSPIEVVCPLPEGFDANEGRDLLVRNVGEAPPKTVRVLPPSITNSVSRFSTYQVFFCADQDTHHRQPPFVGDASVNASQERNLLRSRGVPFRWSCHGQGGDHGADVV